MLLKFRCTFSFMLFLCSIIVSAKEKPTIDPLLTEKLYTKFLESQRAQQLAAIKSFQKSPNEKKREMITLMSSKIFELIQESRAVVEASSFIPGITEFPAEQNVRVALSNIIEKIALFSEFALRFPDICKAMLSVKNNFKVMFEWGIAYCYQVEYLLDKSTKKVLHLVQQELDYIPKDPNYTNPYRLIRDDVENYENNVDVDDDEDEKKIKKKRKKIKKGPKVSFYDEL